MSKSGVWNAAEKRCLELYIHIPFCVKKCDYCDFLSAPADRRMQKAYVDALLREIQGYGHPEGKNAAFPTVSSVFIGGGTPSILEGSDIGRIMDQARENFRISPDAEITIETNPGTLTAKKLQAYRNAGINRLSLGLQSADERELRVLGRIHTYEEFLESYRLARQAGFSNINVDLMFAIPGQTCEGWLRNLRTVAELEPEHISAYSLIVEEGTPFADRELDLPDEDTEYRMYEDTAAVLAEYGYRQYEISNYAKPGYSCRHNIGYWNRTQYLGLGLGAASLIRTNACLVSERAGNKPDKEKDTGADQKNNVLDRRDYQNDGERREVFSGSEKTLQDHLSDGEQEGSSGRPDRMLQDYRNGGEPDWSSGRLEERQQDHQNVEELCKDEKQCFTTQEQQTDAADSFHEYRFNNTPILPEYLTSSADPQSIRRDLQTLTVKDCQEEFMFLGLRMTEGISETDFQNQFGQTLDSVYGDVLKKYKEMGFLAYTGGRWYFTRMGIHVSNQILTDFLQD